jgi:hypothetical protein
MTEDLPVVVLDACVLANHTLCDLLLRLAEEPHLYTPKWSAEILAETTRTLETKFEWPASLVSYFESEVRRSFPEALVTDYERLIPRMTNHPNDRHVVAAAVVGNASRIATFNLRHFKPADLEKWNVVAVHPQHILQDMFQRGPGIVRQRMEEQSTRRKITVPRLLEALRPSVPEFVQLLDS